MDALTEDERDEARHQEVLEAGADLTAALRRLYRAQDGDEIAVGEVEYECNKAARSTYLDPEYQDSSAWATDDAETKIAHAPDPSEPGVPGNDDDRYQEG